MRKKRKTVFLGNIVLTTFLLSVVMIKATEDPEYTIRQLTDNEHDGVCPKIHNGQVVWIGGDVNGCEIFLYDGDQVMQLTDNEYEDVAPQIHNGQVVWGGMVGDEPEIFLYNGTKIIQLSSNGIHDDNNDTQIHNGQVVWPGVVGDDDEIFLYDGSRVIQLTNNERDDGGGPQIHNGQVVWRSICENSPEIFLYDGARVIQLTNNEYYDGEPQIHNGQVVWDGWDVNGCEIFLYDGTQVIQLTNNECDDLDPKIHNGQVVWDGWDGNEWEVFLYDGTQVIQLTNNEYDDLDPKIHNGQVVWMGWDGNEWEIFLYDGTQVIQLTDNEYDDGAPQIHNGQIVWEGNGEIFLATPVRLDLLVDSNNDGFVDKKHDNPVETNDLGFVLWANNDNDHWEVTDRYWSEDSTTAKGQKGEPDNVNNTINGIHDLEDFFSMRLQIPVTNTVAGEKFYLEGAPIRVFKRYFVSPDNPLNNNGPRQLAYLTDLDTARQQHLVDMLGEVGIDSPLEIKREDFTSGVLWLIFEGVSTGGPYDLKFYSEINGQTNNVDTAKITIKNVRDMYKFWNLRVGLVTNALGFEVYAETPQRPVTCTGEYYPQNPDRMFVFLHGYNVDTQGAMWWDDTMYKRLYRAGYRGGFSGITWEGNEPPTLEPWYFSRNWVNAFRSAELTKQTIINIKNEWGNGPITVGAHSLGNMVALSAARLLTYEADSSIVSKIIHLEAAVPANIYQKVVLGPADYFDGSFRPNFDVVPMAVNSWSDQDEILNWFDIGLLIFGWPTPNYKEGPVFAPPPILNKHSMYGAMGKRPSAQDFPSELPPEKSFYDWYGNPDKDKHPYGIRDHSSMANEYYSDVADFFDDFMDEIE